MELSKQEMELFLPLQGPWSKIFFYNMEWNRKWNYPNRIWNYFSHFQASDQKTSFTKWFSLVTRVSKLIFQTGNGIFQTGNGIISPTSRPLIKKLLFQLFPICPKGFKIDFQNRKWKYPNRKWNYFSHFKASDKKSSFTISFSFVLRVQNWFRKQEMELSKQEMEFFLPLPGLWSKNFF